MKWLDKFFDNFLDLVEVSFIAAALAGAMLGTTIAVLLFLFVGV